MSTIRVQTIIPLFTNIPTDVVTNTTHWTAPGTEIGAAMDIIADRLEGFYSAAYTGSTISANYANWGAVRVEGYNLADPPPRIPEVRPITPSVSPSASAVPTEVACVVSYHAAPISGVVRQRLHNRFYLGCLGTGVMNTSASNRYPQFTTEYIEQVADAAAALLALNDVDAQWVQFSEAGGVAVEREIAGGWVDNSPDTQRRRSVLAASRTNWS